MSEKRPEWAEAVRAAVHSAGSLARAAQLIRDSIQASSQTPVDVEHVRRNLLNWQGGRWAPSEFYRSHIERALGVPVAAFPPAGRDRRTTERPDCDAMSSMEEKIRQCWRLDDEFGAASVLPEITTWLEEAKARLRENLPTVQRPRVMRITAELHHLAAWGHFDSQNYAGATTYFIDALSLAREAGDRLFEANVLSGMSLQATYEGTATRALTLALAADDAIVGCESPRVRALLAMRAAFAYAVVGDERGCHTAIGRCQEHLSNVGQGEDPPWALYFDDAKMTADSGIARGRLGEYKTAAGLLNEALAVAPPERVRLRVFHLVWMANIQLSDQHLDEACALAGRAAILASRLDSPRTEGHISQFNERLSPYSSARPVVEFREIRADLNRIRCRP